MLYKLDTDARLEIWVEADNADEASQKVFDTLQDFKSTECDSFEITPDTYTPKEV